MLATAATAAAAAGGGGWRDGYVLLSTQRAKSTLTAPLLCKADEVSETMRTVSAETVGAADGTAAGNADTCLRYAHGEDSQAHGAHSPPTHRRMPVSIAAPQAHGCASAAVHGAGSAVRRAHAHGVYLPRSAECKQWRRSTRHLARATAQVRTSASRRRAA